MPRCMAAYMSSGAGRHEMPSMIHTMENVLACSVDVEELLYGRGCRWGDEACLYQRLHQLQPAGCCMSSMAAGMTMIRNVLLFEVYAKWATDVVAAGVRAALYMFGSRSSSACLCLCASLQYAAPLLLTIMYNLKRRSAR